jgi:hypothetical protein
MIALARVMVSAHLTLLLFPIYMPMLMWHQRGTNPQAAPAQSQKG